MKRTVGFVVGVLGSVALLAGPAAAHSSGLAIDTTLYSDGSIGQVTGVVTCTAGNELSVGVKVRQGGVLVADGVNSSGNVCTGSPQEFTVRVSGALVAGPAAVTATAFSTVGNTIHGIPSSRTATITVVI